MELYFASASLSRGDFFPNIAVKCGGAQGAVEISVSRCGQKTAAKSHHTADLKCGHNVGPGNRHFRIDQKCSVLHLQSKHQVVSQTSHPAFCWHCCALHHLALAVHRSVGLIVAAVRQTDQHFLACSAAHVKLQHWQQALL
jgi:hypothetical protein